MELTNSLLTGHIVDFFGAYDSVNFTLYGATKNKAFEVSSRGNGTFFSWVPAQNYICRTETFKII